MTKKVKYDVVLSISISKEQNKKIEKKSEKHNGNISAVIRELINKMK